MNLVPWRQKNEGKSDGGSMQISRLKNDMDQLFDQFFRDPWSSLARGFGPTLAGGPVVDVSETDDKVLVAVELPGVDPKDLEIDVSGNTLSIRGEKKQEHEEKDRNYCYSERSFGRFQRLVDLPTSVDPDKVDAVCRNGTLTITLAKRADAQRKKIQIREG